MRAFLVLYLVSLVACGGQEADNVSEPQTGTYEFIASPAFAGKWEGTRWQTYGTDAPAYDVVTATVAVDGPTVRVANLCPGGGGVIHMTAGGRTASWGGTLVCKLKVQSCSSGEVAYTSATAELTDKGSMIVRLSGRANRCGADVSAASTLIGRR